MTRLAMSSGEDQPHSWPKESPKVRAISPKANNSAPNGSNLPRPQRIFSFSTPRVRMTPMMPIGMFTKKIQRHERWVVMMPPSVGPVLTPRATTTALRPSALPRSLGGKAPVSIAGLMAIIIAPPRPCKARAAIKKTSEGANPQKAEPIVKMVRPAAQIGLCPIMSATRPVVSSTPAITTR